MTPSEAVAEVVLDTYDIVSQLGRHEGGPAVLVDDRNPRCPARPYVVVDAPSSDVHDGPKEMPGRAVSVPVRVYADNVVNGPDADDLALALRSALLSSTPAFDGMRSWLVEVDGPVVSPTDSTMVGRLLVSRMRAQ